MTNRAQWTNLTESQLLAQCEVDTYRASGPGGQKRNKTSSAVRLRHPPSGLLVIAEESRSQHENKARALRRLRQAFFLKIREDVKKETVESWFLAVFPEFETAKDELRRIHLGRKDSRFWPTVGFVLDILQAHEARVSDAAAALKTSTGNLIDFLQTEPKVWEQVNGLRVRFGQKPLRSGS